MQKRDQAADVVRMKAASRFVEHEERIHQARAKCSGQCQTLELAACEVRGWPVEREVVEADIRKVGEAFIDLRQQAGGSGPVIEPLFFLEQSSQIADRKRRERGDVAALDLDSQRLGSEPSPVAGRAGQKPPEAAYKQAVLEPVCPAFETAEECLQALKLGIG